MEDNNLKSTEESKKEQPLEQSDQYEGRGPKTPEVDSTKSEPEANIAEKLASKDDVIPKKSKRETIKETISNLTGGILPHLEAIISRAASQDKYKVK